jgi:hypothetical protein
MGDGPAGHYRVTRMATPLENAIAELKRAWQDCRPSCEPPERLYHYTSLEGLLGILGHKTLWLAEASTLNDTSEMRFGGEAVAEVLQAGHSSALDLHAVAEKEKRFLEGLTSHGYVFCFCREHDLLSQWRAYGGGAAGFEIEFDRVPLEAYLARQRVSDPTPMLYGKDEVKQAAGRFLSEASAIAAKPEHSLKGSDLAKFEDEFGFRLSLLALATKDPCFSGEREWRIIRVRREGEAVRFRSAHGIIVPYLDLSCIPPEVFVGVTLGPKVDADLGGETVRLFLESNGLGHAQVRRSRVPLRRPS